MQCAYGESNLTAGAENEFYVVVMAEDGTTTQIYTINGTP
jgi:hypothetical protein